MVYALSLVIKTTSPLSHATQCRSLLTVVIQKFTQIWEASKHTEIFRCNLFQKHSRKYASVGLSSSTSNLVSLLHYTFLNHCFSIRRLLRREHIREIKLSLCSFLLRCCPGLITIEGREEICTSHFSSRVFNKKTLSSERWTNDSKPTEWKNRKSGKTFSINSFIEIEKKTSPAINEQY